jgi:hypothetical protein
VKSATAQPLRSNAKRRANEALTPRIVWTPWGVHYATI